MASRIIPTQGHSYLVIPKALLAAPFHSKLAREFPDQSPELVGYPELPADLVASVKAVIGMMLPYGYPDLPAVADLAGVSRRTMQRMLKESNVSYSQLVERHRMDIACALLEDTDNPVNEIAIGLAYEEPANFTRAFKRKSGVSPTEYRMSARAIHPSQSE